MPISSVLVVLLHLGGEPSVPLSCVHLLTLPPRVGLARHPFLPFYSTGAEREMPGPIALTTYRFRQAQRSEASGRCRASPSKLGSHSPEPSLSKREVVYVLLVLTLSAANGSSDRDPGRRAAKTGLRQASLPLFVPPPPGRIRATFGAVLLLTGPRREGVATSRTLRELDVRHHKVSKMYISRSLQS
jgi:hypothetical protein